MIQTGENEYVVVAVHDSMRFVFFKDALEHNHEKHDYLGYYIDHSGIRQSVSRGSIYGAHAGNHLNYST